MAGLSSAIARAKQPPPGAANALLAVQQMRSAHKSGDSGLHRVAYEQLKLDMKKQALDAQQRYNKQMDALSDKLKEAQSKNEQFDWNKETLDKATQALEKGDIYLYLAYAATNKEVAKDLALAAAAMRGKNGVNLAAIYGVSESVQNAMWMQNYLRQKKAGAAQQGAATPAATLPTGPRQGSAMQGIGAPSAQGQSAMDRLQTPEGAPTAAPTAPTAPAAPAAAPGGFSVNDEEELKIIQNILTGGKFPYGGDPTTAKGVLEKIQTIEELEKRRANGEFPNMSDKEWEQYKLNYMLGLEPKTPTSTKLSAMEVALREWDKLYEEYPNSMSNSEYLEGREHIIKGSESGKSTAKPSALEDRLRLLKSNFQKGLITEAEYKQGVRNALETSASAGKSVGPDGVEHDLSDTLPQVQSGYLQVTAGMVPKASNQASKKIRDAWDLDTSRGDENYTTTKGVMREIVYNAATAETKKSQDGRKALIGAMDALQEALEEVYDELGEIPVILRGPLQQLLQKMGINEEDGTDLGMDSMDPRVVNYFGTRLRAALIAYRKATSGSAFTESEARDYDNLFPGLDKGRSTNDAKFDAIRDFAAMRYRLFYANRLGEDAGVWVDDMSAGVQKSAVEWWKRTQEAAAFEQTIKTITEVRDADGNPKYTDTSTNRDSIKAYFFEKYLTREMKRKAKSVSDSSVNTDTVNINFYERYRPYIEQYIDELLDQYWNTPAEEGDDDMFEDLDNDLKGKIEEARHQGYSDDDIAASIAVHYPQLSIARIQSYFG